MCMQIVGWGRGLDLCHPFKNLLWGTMVNLSGCKVLQVHQLLKREVMLESHQYE